MSWDAMSELFYFSNESGQYLQLYIVFFFANSNFLLFNAI